VMTQFCQAKNMSPLKLNISSSFTLFCWCKWMWLRKQISNLWSMWVGGSAHYFVSG
jgi:hypothetical protein